MTDTREMIDSSSASASVELAAAIDALRDCEQVSSACAMAMVQTGGMVVEVRRALDCADVCDAAWRVTSRGVAADAGVVAAVLNAAVTACEASADACGAHAEHHPHCKLHAASARACADALRALLKL